jgi:hypothetical protein
MLLYMFVKNIPFRVGAVTFLTAGPLGCECEDFGPF